MNDLLSDISTKYRHEGLFGLFTGAVQLVRMRVHQQYISFYHYSVRDRLPTGDDTVMLNGVECVIERSVADRFVPFYEPPWPTVDEPAYEATEVEAVQDYCSPGNRVVVIGGGLGVTAVIAAREVGADGTVDVYEPSREAYEHIKTTVSHSDLGEIINLHHASVTTETNPSFTYRKEITPRVIAPEDLPDADIYEMDCEGAEIPILEGLAVRPAILLIETHRNHSEVVSLLDELDYEVENVVSDGRNQWEGATHVRARYQGQSN